MIRRFDIDDGSEKNGDDLCRVCLNCIDKKKAKCRFNDSQPEPIVLDGVEGWYCEGFPK